VRYEIAFRLDMSGHRFTIEGNHLPFVAALIQGVGAPRRNRSAIICRQHRNMFEQRKSAADP
jgi:hypothetical protein